MTLYEYTDHFIKLHPTENMSEQQQSTCLCTDHGYAPDCPFVFVQGDEMYHSITAEMRLKPRVYQTPQPLNTKGIMKINRDVDNLGHAHDEKKSIVPPTTRGYSHISELKDQLPNVEEMMHTDEALLSRFQALEVNGSKLTDFVIGGYTLDVAKAAEKARAIAPLPPARLPKVFAHGDMNFNHHLFQGLERILGKEKFLSVVKVGKYDGTSDAIILPMIISILEGGFEQSDNDITVFTKYVIQTTFETDKSAMGPWEHSRVIAAANLWGFQYLESMMTCTESDLEMWLHIQYNHFRNMWFNTFKDSGIPEFALDGVQARYVTKIYPPHGNAKYAALNSKGEVLAWEDTKDDDTLLGRSHHRRERRSRAYRETEIEKEQKPTPRRFF